MYNILQIKNEPYKYSLHSLHIPDVLFLNSFFYFLYTFISLNSFLVFTTLWAIIRSLSYSSLLDLDLSINFLYATFLSSISVYHSSSNHPKLSGFGWYPNVCSAFCTMAAFNCFHSSSSWVSFSLAPSVLIFSDYFPRCCWYSVVILGSFGLPILNLLGFLFISLFLCAIFLSQKVKCLGHETGYSPPCSAEVKEWSCMSIRPYYFMVYTSTTVTSCFRANLFCVVEIRHFCRAIFGKAHWSFDHPRTLLSVSDVFSSIFILCHSQKYSC